MPSSHSPSFWSGFITWILAFLKGSRPTPTPTGPEPRRQWTFMVYLAGDNNLEAAARKDLTEMKSVGSTDQVNIVAQFDGVHDQGTRRYHIRRQGSLDDDVVARLPEVNTGDPAALRDFVLWAHQHYAAERYALILWNHGTGWKDEDIYYGLRKRGIRPDELTRGQMRSLTSGNSSRSLFRSSIETLAVETVQKGRAILFDDTSADFLDNVEMKQVLEQAAEQIGRKIDLLGCDACLMSMLEVAYQLRTSCSCFVASQEEEPGDGWPYDMVLRRLVENPDMSPRLLAATIVEEYNNFYRNQFPNLPVTQSAMDLEHLDPLAQGIDALADVLRAALEADWQKGNALISLALYDVQKFTDRDYVDLAHFCELLAEQNPRTAIADAAQRLIELLQQSGDDSIIIAEGHSGPGMRHVTGASIYLPQHILSPLYMRLLMTQEHRWDEFLHIKLDTHQRSARKTFRPGGPDDRTPKRR